MLITVRNCLESQECWIVALWIFSVVVPYFFIYISEELKSNDVNDATCLARWLYEALLARAVQAVSPRYLIQHKSVHFPVISDRLK